MCTCQGSRTPSAYTMMLKPVCLPCGTRTARPGRTRLPTSSQFRRPVTPSGMPHGRHTGFNIMVYAEGVRDPCTCTSRRDANRTGRAVALRTVDRTTSDHWAVPASRKRLPHSRRAARAGHRPTQRASASGRGSRSAPGTSRPLPRRVAAEITFGTALS